MAAIAKAKEILTEGVKVFLQVKSTLKDDDEDSNVRNQVRLHLQQIRLWYLEIASPAARSAARYMDISSLHCVTEPSRNLCDLLLSFCKKPVIF